MSQELFNKLSEITESQARVETHLDNHRVLLEKHTSQLERHNDLLLRLTITVERHEERSTKLEVRQDYLEKALQLVKDLVTKLQGVGYLVKLMGVVAGSISAICGVLWGAYQFFQKLGL